MTNEVDIIENSLLEEYGQEIFDLLLTDHSMTLYKNDGQTHHIFWATHDYEQLGEGYSFYDEIMAERITGEHSDVIMPRVMKKKTVQNKRVKKMSGLEIERKFLIKKGGSWKEAAFSSSHIKQGYMPCESATVRVRTRDDRSWLTIKSHSDRAGCPAAD